MFQAAIYPRRHPWFFAVALVVVGALFGAANWEATRQERERMEVFRSDVDEKAELASTIIKGRLNAYDATLLALREFYVADPAQFAQRLQWLRQGPLADRDILVVVIDRAGYVSYTDAPGATPHLNLRDTHFFRFFADDSRDRFYADGPLFGRVTQRHTMPLARPIYDKNGAFDGIIALSVLQVSLANFGSKLQLSGDTTVSVVTERGAVVTRSRDLAKVQGTTIPAQRLAQLLQGNSGVFQDRSTVGSGERIVAFRHLEGVPLIVYVSDSPRELMAVAAKERILLMSGAGVFSLLVILLLLVYLQRQRLTAKFIATQQTHLKDAQRIAKMSSWELDLVTHQFKFSDAVYPLFGVKRMRPGYSLERFLSNVVEPDRVGVAAAIEQAAKAGASNFEYGIQLRDGQMRIMAGSGEALRDKSGKVTSLLGTVRDITESKLAEQALHKSEHSYRIMFDSAPGGVWMIGSDRRTTQVNQKMCDMLGYAREDLLGRNPVELADEENGKIFEEKAGIVPNRQTRIYEVAMRHRDGHNIPCEFSATHLFNEDGSVMGVLAFVTDLTERKKTESQIQSLAFSDPLTGLPNRRLLLDRLEQALTAGARHQRQGALLYIDLDDFKTLNDTLGYEHGDLLLQQVSQRLLTCVREGDTVAHVSGDEFVVLLEDLSQNQQEAASQAEAVGKKILNVLNQPYQLGQYAQHSTSSIGITLFGGTEREAIAEPLKRAELAMYQAKAVGRNTLRFFEAQMQAAVTARAALEAGLREAVLQNQFVLHYQAQVTDEGRITGVEALVRWFDPKRGMVSPAEFIPLAEETNLILPLGQWVLEAACKQLALWASQPEMAHLTIAVNVSARQFHRKDFVDQVLTVLESTGTKPQRLKLELTESLLVANIEDVIAKMSALKGMGVGFSLDDFGTGYSSLSYLKRLPLDQLKIDISFVRDILIDANDAAIARMVIVLAESLGLAVIAEGVETQAQRAALADLGCHAYQGYLFSKPLPINEFEALAKGTSNSTCRE
jgi:diguanylate cyclase (GGDEF)-like protein/PAS domain S-box-containing protein